MDRSTRSTGALTRLCDELADVVGFLYPFGSATVIGLLVMWAIALAIVFIEFPERMFAAFGAVFVAVVVAAATLSENTYATVVALLE